MTVWRLPLFRRTAMVQSAVTLALGLLGLMSSFPAASAIDNSADVPDPTEGVSMGLGINTTPGGSISLDFAMENITSYTGDNVKIRCEISGTPLPTYRWYRNTEPIDEVERRDRRYSAKVTIWGSRLKIDNARPDDSAEYRCVGSNMYGEQVTTGTLTVRRERNPNGKPDRDRDRNPDRDDDYYDLGPHNNNGEIVYQDPYDSGSNENMDGTGPSYGYNPAEETGESFCQSYRGAACSKYLTNKNIYVTSKVEQGWMEEQLTRAVTVMGSEMTAMSQSCARYAFEAVCYFAIAQCDSSGLVPKPRKLCQDECFILTTEVCKDEYQRIKSNPLIGAANDDLLPVCSSLPPRGTPEGDNCLTLGLKGHTCYNHTGENYKGTVSRTVSGMECDQWKNHYRPEVLHEKYPELRGNHNHCRNPGKQESQPWCYVRGYRDLKELCDVPKCGVLDKATSGGLMYIVGPVVAVVCAIIIIMTVICICQRRKKQRNGDHKPVPCGAPPGQLEMNAMLKPPVQTKSKEFPINSIKFIQDIGEGVFGKVFKGELVGCYGDNSLTPVVIKVLKDTASAKVQQDFHRELETVTDFKHPNIVLMLGACLKQRPQCMLYEYLAHGDLHEYLTMHSPHSDISVSDDDGAVHILDRTDMLHMSTQIAAGMEYLGLHQYIHKDLATRNILVGDNMNVKIADFGIARSVYSSDYYRLQNQSQVPVRWMPPEAILYGKFGIESDIWSFGVVLWEIYSYGLQPYYGYANTEVVEMIRGRQILPCPEDCPSRVYSLMVDCWHEVPGRRPCFKEIHQRLCQWQKEAHVMANNPRVAINMAHSASGHSSSTHTSHSHPSHHSSTGGPSNNTTTTGVTGSSTHSPPHMLPPQGFQHPGYGQMPPNIGHHPMNYNHPGRNPPHYGQVMGVPQQPQYNNRGPQGVHALYRKPSPPASVSSHSQKSSSLQSDSPDASMSKTSTPSPTKIKTPMSLADNKDLYIPDNRTSEI